MPTDPLGELAAKSEVIDLVYLSHIDQNHIGGILLLMDDEVEWRVYSYQENKGNSAFKKPKFPRPADIVIAASLTGRFGSEGGKLSRSTSILGAKRPTGAWAHHDHIEKYSKSEGTKVQYG